ncbi:hypothetical protein ABPG72_009185 [Tetrahymena utriculariae]
MKSCFSISFDHSTVNQKQFLSVDLSFINEDFEIRNNNLRTFEVTNSQVKMEFETDSDKDSSDSIYDISRGESNSSSDSSENEDQADKREEFALESKVELTLMKDECNAKIETPLKTIFLTSDGATANKKAYQISNSFDSHFVCYCHLLNNTIMKTYENFKPFYTLLQKINRISKAFRYSPQLKRIWKNNINQLYHQKISNSQTF